jgi:sulfur-carrier protein
MARQRGSRTGRCQGCNHLEGVRIERLLATGASILAITPENNWTSPAQNCGAVLAIEVEAKNVRGVIREMDKLYPGLGHHLEEETTVAIDGQIHETAYFQPIRPGCEVFFIPKLEGG